jgi:hypothetical protein
MFPVEAAWFRPDDIPWDGIAARTDVPEELTSRSVKSSAFRPFGGVAFANRSVA